jgi:hypothetical protein
MVPNLSSLRAAGSAALPNATVCITSDDDPTTVTSRLANAFETNLSGGNSIDTYASAINELGVLIIGMLAQNSITDDGDDRPAAVYVTTAGTNYSLALVLSEVEAGGEVEFAVPFGFAISGGWNGTAEGLSYPFTKRQVKGLNKQYATINFAQNTYGRITIIPADSDLENGTTGTTKYPVIAFSPKSLPATGVWGGLAVGAGAVGVGASAPARYA